MLSLPNFRRPNKSVDGKSTTLDVAALKERSEDFEFLFSILMLQSDHVNVIHQQILEFAWKTWAQWGTWWRELMFQQRWVWQNGTFLLHQTFPSMKWLSDASNKRPLIRLPAKMNRTRLASQRQVERPTQKAQHKTIVHFKIWSSWLSNSWTRRQPICIFFFVRRLVATYQCTCNIFYGIVFGSKKLWLEKMMTSCLFRTQLTFIIYSALFFFHIITN